MKNHTIFGIATASGRAGIAVIRVSGPDAGSALRAIHGDKLPPPRKAVRSRLRDPATGETIDNALCLWFPSPSSMTGEDLAEFHIHGGYAVSAALAAALHNMEGIRTAEPGEFTRRAFENGKLDLTEAEAIADLVNSETAAQRRQALHQLDGNLGQLYNSWSGSLTQALAHVEAHFDFSDEVLPADLIIGAKAQITNVLGEMSAHLDDNGRGERIRNGIKIAIVGPPNVGKSSLLNVLAGRDAAIVAETAGTTRDVIEVNMDLGGFGVVVADTAGLREAEDAIEREGVLRARARAEDADIVIAMLDATVDETKMHIERKLLGDDSIVAVNKIDLQRPISPLEIAGHQAMEISVTTGEGIERLIETTRNLVAERFAVGETPILTRARHRTALEECATALRGAATSELPDLMAEDLRLAVRMLGRITGSVGVEDILDVVFAEFCIGK